MYRLQKSADGDKGKKRHLEETTLSERDKEISERVQGFNVSHCGMSLRRKRVVFVVVLHRYLTILLNDPPKSEGCWTNRS